MLVLSYFYFLPLIGYCNQTIFDKIKTVKKKKKGNHEVDLSASTVTLI